jgi:hypothetical protein
VKAREPCGEKPTAQEPSKLLLDKSRQTIPFVDASGLGSKRLEVITHHLKEHASGWGLRHVPGRVTTSHVPVVANGGPVDADAASHAIPSAPLAHER